MLDIPDRRTSGRRSNIPDPGNPVVGAKGIGEPGIGVGGGARAVRAGRRHRRRHHPAHAGAAGADHDSRSQAGGSDVRTAHGVHLGGTIHACHSRRNAGVRVVPADLDRRYARTARAPRSDAWVMAGGLDSFDWLKDRIKRPRVVIDLGGVAELRGIKEANGGLEIGANTTLTEISANHAVVQGEVRAAGPGGRPRGLAADPQPGNDRRQRRARTRAATTTAPAGRAIAPAATSATPTRRRRSIASTRSSKPIAASR